MDHPQWSKCDYDTENLICSELQRLCIDTMETSDCLRLDRSIEVLFEGFLLLLFLLRFWTKKRFMLKEC